MQTKVGVCPKAVGPRVVLRLVLRLGCAQTPSSSEPTHPFQIHTAFPMGLGAWGRQMFLGPFWPAGFQMSCPVMGWLQGALDGGPC